MKRRELAVKNEVICPPRRMMSSTQVLQKSDSKDKMLSNEDKDFLDLFGKPNLILKVGDRSLYVRKELLMEKSAVFKRMFETGFKEATAMEIPLPGKDPLVVSRFLVYISSGCEKNIDEKTAHEILPLANEYQTDSLLKQIDTLLANVVKQGGDSITINRIIWSILEAELYDMKLYLDECINVASRKKSGNLTSGSNYIKVTPDTKVKIMERKLSHIEKVYNCGYSFEKKDIEPYMKTY